MNIQYKFVVATVIGVFVAGFLSGLIFLKSTSPETTELVDEPEPLYWVALMDPNYRRDGPGKSPMGMDLIPVYADDAGTGSGPGTVSISPEVVNNLGVRTAQAEYLALQSVIDTVGYIGYDEDNLVHIHTRIEGWIEKLYVSSDGDPIESGQPLYELYSPELVAAQEELLLAIARDNTALIEGAESRLRALQISQQNIDKIRSEGQALQSVVFLSPSNGVVDSLNIREGFYVTPSNTLMSIGNLDQVWVEVEVY